MSQVDVSIEDCKMLSDRLPAAEIIAINTPKRLQKALKKKKDGRILSEKTLALERLETGQNDTSQPCISSNQENCFSGFAAFDKGVEEEDTEDDEHDGVESSENFSETIATENNNNVNNSIVGPNHGNDEFLPLKFHPDHKIDFENVARMPGLEDVIDDDPYFLNILERAINIPTLETIIQKLDDCNFDPQHEDFAAALKYLKSVNFGISHIQQMNKKIRSYHAMLDQKSQTFLGLSSTPKKYIEIRWVSLKAFYEPYISPTCRPFKFKQHNKNPDVNRKLPLSFWLTYEDLIFMRVMMGYLNELIKLKNHTPTSVGNERGLSKQKFVDNIYRNNLNKELFEALVQLTSRSRANKNSCHFHELKKGLLTKQQRELRYQSGGNVSDTSDIEDDDNDGVGNADSNPAIKRIRI
ncbi:hypothetical protein ACO0OL_001875 [Hanseniaspora opuntiae]